MYTYIYVYICIHTYIYIHVYIYIYRAMLLTKIKHQPNMNFQLVPTKLIYHGKLWIASI